MLLTAAGKMLTTPGGVAVAAGEAGLAVAPLVGQAGRDERSRRSEWVRNRMSLAGLESRERYQTGHLDALLSGALSRSNATIRAAELQFGTEMVKQKMGMFTKLLENANEGNVEAVKSMVGFTGGDVDAVDEIMRKFRLGGASDVQAAADLLELFGRSA